MTLTDGTKSVAYAADTIVDNDRYSDRSILGEAEELVVGLYEVPTGGFQEQYDTAYLPGLLDLMVGYEKVVGPEPLLCSCDLDADRQACSTFEARIAMTHLESCDSLKPVDPTAERVLVNRKGRERAEEVCRYPWSDRWADRGERYQRGRLDQSTLLPLGGETWNVCTAKSVKDGAVKYTVFLRRHVGTKTSGGANGRGRTTWVWEYDRRCVFDAETEALRFQDALAYAFRNEIQLGEQWENIQFSPGEPLQYDPHVLQSVTDHEPRSED